MRFPAKFPTISTIVMFCVLSLAGAFACAAGATATASPDAGATIKATVAEPLEPGLTATVTVKVDEPAQHARPLGEVVLERIEPDPGHSSCSTSVGGGGADFSMPPVRIDATRASDDRAVMATGRLTMNETGLDQSACRGATLTLEFGAV